jgi:hypothetical protein
VRIPAITNAQKAIVLIVISAQGHAHQPALLVDHLHVPSERSMATYSRASSSTPGAALAKSSSSENRPQECHRLRLTSLAPHFGRSQIAATADPHRSTIALNPSPPARSRP